MPEGEFTWHEGIPIVSVHRAIRGSIDQHVGWNLIDQAIDAAPQARTPDRRSSR